MISSILDREEWIMNRCLELEEESNTALTHELCYHEAEEEWVDHYSAYLDYQYELQKYR